MIQSLLDEFRDAARQLRLRPGFTLGAVISLALGMSLGTAVFSVVRAALKPVPFLEPDRLVVLWEEGKDERSLAWSRVPPRHFVALRNESATIRELAAWRERYALLGESGAARTVTGVSVTENFFSVLRVGPMIGRVFTHDDRDARVVVLSHAIWSSQFGSDRSILGRAVRIGGLEYSVIGVMSSAFDFPRGTRLWFLMHDDLIAQEAASPLEGQNYPTYSAIGRLSPGATVEQAGAEAGLIYGRLYGDHAERRLMTTRASTLGDFLNGRIIGPLRLWMIASGLILVICAVNFATMSLSRGMRRRGEIAVRAAMGATQARLVRASIVEAFLLAVASGALSVVFAAWLIGFANVWFADGSLPVDASIDWVTLAFGVGATVIVGFVFALAPAVELAKVDLRQILAGDSTSATARRGEMRGRRALVALQMTFALAGVAVVAALIKADKRFQAWDVGLDYEQLVLGDLHGPPRHDAMYSFWAFSDSTALKVAPGPVLDRLRGSPGVSDAAIITGGRRLSAFFPNGEIDRAYWSEMHATPNLFEVLGVKLLAGRMPTADERGAGNVLVASDYFARRYAPTIQAAIGMPIRIHRGVRRPKETVTIVGVVPSYGGSGLWGLASSVYVLEDPQPTRFATVVARVKGDPQMHANGMARTLAGLDARILVTNVATAKSRVDAAQGATRGRKYFLSAVAALALMLAVIGVYSLTSYTAEMRMREFGIRIALGAGKGRLAGTVFGELWWMSALGVTGGLLVGGRLTAFLDNMYRNPMMPSPLITLPVGQVVACAATLVVILVLATAVPMRRVFRMDVMRTVQGST